MSYNCKSSKKSKIRRKEKLNERERNGKEPKEKETLTRIIIILFSNLAKLMKKIETFSYFLSILFHFVFFFVILL